jgi:hypothetical protein
VNAVLANLRAELELVKISVLKRRAIADGLPQEALDQVDDSENPRSVP